MLTIARTAVRLESGGVLLEGDLEIPDAPVGTILFAHGSGSSRHSTRNLKVAGMLQDAGFATLLLDLLTRDEAFEDAFHQRYRFDVERLAGRLADAAGWIREQPRLGARPLGCFGSSTGAGAALTFAAERPELVEAVVSRGGRADLAGVALARVLAPTLFIVGGHDPVVLDLNRRAMTEMVAPVKLEVVPRAGHLFEEPSALYHVGRLTCGFFVEHLTRTGA